MGNKFFDDHEGFIDPDLDYGEIEDEEEGDDGEPGEAVHQIKRVKVEDMAGNPVYIESTVGAESTFISLKLHPKGEMLTSFFLDGTDPSMVISTLSHHLEDGRLTTVIGFVEQHGRSISVAPMFRVKLDKYVSDVLNAAR